MGFIIKNSNSLFRKIALIGIICSLGSGMLFAKKMTTDSVEVSGNIVGLSESVCEYRLTFSTSRGDSLPTVVLLSDVFREKRFHIKLQQVATPLTLNVNAVGYQVVHRDLGIVNGKCDIGAIKLTKDTTIDLSAIVVSAKRPLVVEQGMKSKYQISGSMLSEAGNLMALFRRLPNLSVDNGKLTVLDSYGIETIVLLNDRELRDANILEVLNSKDVKSIEIDRNPDILYQGKILIKIETIKKINDYIYNDIDLTYTQGRRPNGNVGTNVRAKFGKVSMGMSYRYAYNNRLIDDEEFRLMPKDGSDLNLVDNIRTKEKEYKHNVLVNLEYTPNEQTNWSLLYNSTFTQQENDVATSRSMQTVTGLKSIRLMQNFPTSEYSHSLSIGLNKAIGKGALTLLADYAVANNTTNFSTTEQDLSTSSYQEVLTKMNSKSHIANILAKYNFTGPLGITLNTGMKSNVVIIPTNYNFTTKETLEVNDILIGGLKKKLKDNSIINSNNDIITIKFNNFDNVNRIQFFYSFIQDFSRYMSFKSITDINLYFDENIESHKDIKDFLDKLDNLKLNGRELQEHILVTNKEYYPKLIFATIKLKYSFDINGIKGLTSVNIGFPDYIKSKDDSSEFQMSIEINLEKEFKKGGNEKEIRKKVLDFLEKRKVESYDKFKFENQL